MFNRTKIKYWLKENLPKFLFTFVIFLWNSLLLSLVMLLDVWRLKNFRKKKVLQIQQGAQKFSIVTDPINGLIDKHIYGSYEPQIMDIIKCHLKQGGTFIGIGANIGQHGLYTSVIVGEKGVTHFFEPIKKLATQIYKSIIENNFKNKTVVHNFALGNKNEIKDFFIHESNIGGSSLVNNERHENKISIEVKDADTFFKKILLKEKPVISFEFLADFYNKNTDKRGEKILNLLIQKLSYSLFDIDDNRNAILDTNFF